MQANRLIIISQLHPVFEAAAKQTHHLVGDAALLDALQAQVSCLTAKSMWCTVCGVAACTCAEVTDRGCTVRAAR